MTTVFPAAHIAITMSAGFDQVVSPSQFGGANCVDRWMPFQWSWWSSIFTGVSSVLTNPIGYLTNGLIRLQIGLSALLSTPCCPLNTHSHRTARETDGTSDGM